MEPNRTNAVGGGPRKSITQCPVSHWSHQPSPFDRSFLDLLHATFTLPKKLWHSFTDGQTVNLPPLHPVVQLIQSQMLALSPFIKMTPKKLSQSAVSIVIPSWLVGTETACHIPEAAERTFGRVVSLESPSSAAYNAAGYELCRISYEAFECSGPGRIMTLEYDGTLALASIMQTPLSNWLANPVTFSARTGLAGQSITEWISSVVESQRPDKIILVGAKADDPAFKKAVADSHAAPYLHGHPQLPSTHILAFGAAQAAKDGIESQKDDCGEPAACEDLRRMADEIAGTYQPPKPSTWPATGPRHLEL